MGKKRVHAIHKPDHKTRDLITACARPSPRIALPYKQHVATDADMAGVDCPYCIAKMNSDGTANWSIEGCHYE
jgi:hypothetical protein